MRQIGSITDETEAKRFGDYLLSAGMKNTVEQGSQGWDVWVEDDDKLDAARAELESFRANPGDPKYDGATRKAERIRNDEVKKRKRLAKRFHDVRTSWGAPQQWVQPVTVVLILASLLVAAATNFGDNAFGPAANALRIQSIRVIDESQGLIEEPSGLTDVRRGQVWRLITPIFVHYGGLHLLFNMFWLFDLGRQIERIRGSVFLLILVLAAAVLPNLAEYAWSGPFFGGMSGVVYALFGYVWIKGKFEPHLGLGVAPQTIVIMFIWLVICMIGIIGNVANAAHVGGFIVGVAAAYGPIQFRKLRRGLKSS